MQNPGPHLQRFWFYGSRVKPRFLYFSSVAKGLWWVSLRNHHLHLFFFWICGSQVVIDEGVAEDWLWGHQPFHNMPPTFLPFPSFGTGNLCFLSFMVKYSEDASSRGPLASSYGVMSTPQAELLWNSVVTAVDGHGGPALEEEDV